MKHKLTILFLLAISLLAFPNQAAAITQGDYTLKSSGGSYSTWAVFWDDLENLDGNLTLTVDDSPFTEDTAPAQVTESLGGHTLTVTAATFPTTTDAETGPRFTCNYSGTFLNLGMVGPGTLIIEGIVMIGDGAVWPYSVGGLTTASDIFIRRCIIKGGSWGFRGSSSLSIFKIYNNIIIGGNYGYYAGLSQNASSFFSNNTIVGGGTSGIEAGFSFWTGTFENNLAYNNSTDFTGIGASAGNNNTSKDDTCADGNWDTGANNRESQANDPFADSGSDDYRLAAASDPIGNAKDLSAFFEDDFFGNARSSWDIGAVEYYPNVAPDLNIWQAIQFDVNHPFAGGIPTWFGDQNITIDFNVFDSDNDRLTVDINYNTEAATGAPGVPIITGLNLTSAVCADQDWADVPSLCKWDWNGAVADGNYYIIIEVDDGTDTDYNISDSNIGIDASPPTTLNNDFNTTHWQNTDANIQFSCSDVNAGCKNFYYGLNDVNYQLGWGDVNIGIVLNYDGNHEIWFWSGDVVDNNEAPQLIYMAIDKKVPTLKATDQNNLWQNTDANILISCFDVNGGCKNLYYGIEGDGNHQKRFSLDLNIGIELTTDGNWHVWFWADDNTTGVGDNNTTPAHIYLAIDKTTPICSQFAVYSNAYGDYYKNDDIVHLEVTCNAIDLNVTFDLADIDDQIASGLCESGGTGTEEDPFILTTIAEVQAMENNLSAWYELCQDIDGSATSGWNGGEGFEPIGDAATPFSGNFDGKGYGITGLYIDRPAESNIGLFGYLTGSISNLGLSNADITGNSTVGALVGMLFNGTIDNSYSSGTVSASVENTGGLAGVVFFGSSQISDSYSTATVSCPQSVGGLVGWAMWGTIYRSYATGSVSGTNSVAGLVGNATWLFIYDSYATGSVTGTGWVGGLVGYKDDDARIYRSYSTGAVSGSSNVGGLVGEEDSPITNVHDSYWDTETSGQEVSDGGTGKSTVEMQQQTTFTDWDFSSIWNIDEGTSYPYVDNNYSQDHTVSASNGLSDGEKTVSFSACDAAGNCDTTPTDTITLDNTVPTTVDNDFNNLWNNNDQNVQFSCSDGSGAGCKNFYYSIIGDTNYQFGWGTDQNIGIVFDTDGNYGVFYWSDDSVDQNAGAKLIYTAIDQTAPTVSISSPSSGSSQTSTTVTLQYTGDDATSGIAKYYVKADGSWIDNALSTSYTFSSQSVASHTYYIRATDNADNNSSDASVSVTIVSPAGPGPGSTTETGVSRPSGGAAAEHLSPPEAVPCSSDADCETGCRCVSGKCAKFFDVKILRADTPIKAGQQFDFTYLLRNPFGKPIDAEVEYWLEKDGKKVVEGREVVFVGAGEEAQFESNLLLLEDMLGKYRFVVQLIHEGTEVFATKDVEVKTSVPLTLDLHISRLPEEISFQPFTIEILVGTNFDERTQVRLNQVIMRGNEILWKSDKHVSVEASRRIIQRLPVLQPGEYRLTITATSGEATTSIIRSFNVTTRVVAGPSISDIIQEKAVILSIIALLLIIAAILAWHYLIVVRFISPTHPARAKIKFVYFSVFAIAFFALLGFTAYLLADLLREFALNELYGLMESSYGVAAQQLAADTLNYALATSYGQQAMALAQSIGLFPLG